MSSPVLFFLSSLSFLCLMIFQFPFTLPLACLFFSCSLFFTCSVLFLFFLTFSNCLSSFLLSVLRYFFSLFYMFIIFVISADFSLFLFRPSTGNFAETLSYVFSSNLYDTYFAQTSSFIFSSNPQDTPLISHKLHYALISYLSSFASFP